MPINRDQIAAAERWDLRGYYPSDTAWRQELDQALGTTNTAYTVLDQNFKREFKSLDQVIAVLEAFNSLKYRDRKLSVFAQARYDEDRSGQIGQEMLGQVYGLRAKFERAAFWIPYQLLKTPHLLNECLQSSALAIHHVYLREIRRNAPHMPSEDLAHLLINSDRAFRGHHFAYQKLVDVNLKFSNAVDSQGKEHEVSKQVFEKLMAHDDQTLRKSAYEVFHAGIFEKRDTLAAMFNGTIDSHWACAQAHQFSSSLDFFLFEHDIPKELYLLMMLAVRNRIPSFQRYLKLRARWMKLERLQRWDLHNSVVQMPQIANSMSLDEAKALVLNALGALGKDYVEALQRGLNEDGWFDFRTSKSKRSGIVKYSCQGGHPLALMHFTDRKRDLMDLTTLAGYTMHSHFSDRAQPFQTSAVSDLTTKAVAHLNHQLVLEHRAHLTSWQPMETAQILAENLHYLSHSIFGNALLNEFERRAHEICERGNPLTADILEKLYAELSAEFYGSACADHPLSEIEWASINHLHHRFLFFPSILGVASGIGLFDLIFDDPVMGSYKVIELLKAGSSDSPLNLLKKTGVNLSLSDVTERVFNRFDQLLNQFEALTDQLKGDE